MSTTLLRFFLLAAIALSACSEPFEKTDHISNSEAIPQKIIEGEFGEKLQRKLIPFIEKIRTDHDMETAIAIGVTHGSKIVFAQSMGFADIETQRKANLNTPFHIASISKTFVATAIALLEEEGKLNSDDFVIEHLPFFKLKSGSFENITIKHLLSHTSGLPKHLGPDEWKKPSFDEEAIENFVREAEKLELEFDPGADFSYSDVGFITLGLIISKTSGMPFEEYIQKNIFDPAKLGNSTFLKPEVTPSDWAMPHLIGLETEVWKYFPYNRQYSPANGMHASILDLCRWNILMLDSGKLGGVQVMNPEIIKTITTPLADTPWGGEIGYSWFLQSFEGMPNIMHTGADMGFEAQVLLYPEEDISVIVLANRDYSRTARIANGTMEIIKNLEVKPYTVSAEIPFKKVWSENGLDSAKAFWQELLKDTTDIYYANEWELNLVGHGFINMEDYARAKEAFAFNIELFPEAPNTYDSYGDALIAEGDTASAINYFQKALSVDPEFEDPKPKLKSLGITKN